MSDPDDELIGEEAARIVGVSPQHLGWLARQGVLGRRVLGRYWVFTRAELEAYKAAPKNKGGRPKNDPSPTMKYETPALAGS